MKISKFEIKKEGIISMFEIVINRHIDDKRNLSICPELRSLLSKGHKEDLVYRFFSNIGSHFVALLEECIAHPLKEYHDRGEEVY